MLLARSVSTHNPCGNGVIGEVGRIGRGNGLGKSHRKAQEYRAEQDDAGRATKGDDCRAGCERADDAQQEMTAWTPGVELRATRKGSQDHENVHEQDGQRCRDDRGIVRIGKGTADKKLDRQGPVWSPHDIQ